MAIKHKSLDELLVIIWQWKKEVILFSIFLILITFHWGQIEMDLPSLHNVWNFPLEQISPRKMKVLTWNVWFDRLEEDRRWNAFSQTIQIEDPDVLCFQEVTYGFLHFLKLQPWISNYQCSDSNLTGSTFDQYSFYGVITLAKKSFQPTFQIFPFDSDMGRVLVLTTISILDSPFVIGNVHLESLNFPHLRKKQIKQSSVHLPKDRSILCGDFNFCSYRNFKEDGSPLENDSIQEILPHHLDLWPHLHGSEKGYTFDSEVNLMLPRYEQMRYDRMLVSVPQLVGSGGSKSSESSPLPLSPSPSLIPPTGVSITPTKLSFLSDSDDEKEEVESSVSEQPHPSPSSTSHSTLPPPVLLMPLSIQLLGTQPIHLSPSPLFPSDHFGLLAEFEIQ